MELLNLKRERDMLLDGGSVNLRQYLLTRKSLSDEEMEKREMLLSEEENLRELLSGKIYLLGKEPQVGEYLLNNGKKLYKKYADYGENDCDMEVMKNLYLDLVKVDGNVGVSPREYEKLILNLLVINNVLSNREKINVGALREQVDVMVDSMLEQNKKISSRIMSVLRKSKNDKEEQNKEIQNLSMKSAFLVEIGRKLKLIEGQFARYKKADNLNLNIQESQDLIRDVDELIADDIDEEAVNE